MRNIFLRGARGFEVSVKILIQEVGFAVTKNEWDSVEVFGTCVFRIWRRELRSAWRAEGRE